MPDPGKIESYSNLAAQYGPFFFSILFVLFVPVLGQSWFAGILKAKIKDPEQKQHALSVYKFYWMSGIISGLLLVAVSIAWWAYVQANYILPAQYAVFEAKINEALNKRIFEGIIRNVTSDDVFINDFTSSDYKLYFYPDLSFSTVRYAVIFTHPPKDIPVVAFSYTDRERYERANREGRGETRQRIKLCLGSGARELDVIRVPPSSIRFDVQCDEGLR